MKRSAITALDWHGVPGSLLRAPIVHWQRLAWPVMPKGRCVNAQHWELVR